MANLNNIVYITQAQKYELTTTGAIAAKNHIADPNNIYLVGDEAAWVTASVSSSTGITGNIDLYPGCFYQIYFRPNAMPSAFFNFAPIYIHYPNADTSDTYIYTSSAYYYNTTGSDYGMLFLSWNRITVNSDGTIKGYFELTYGSSNLASLTSKASGTLYYRRMNL